MVSIMSSVSKVTSVVKKISGKPMGAASKVLGAATIASVLYDAHVNGKENAICKNRLDSADRFEKAYKNYLESDSESATVCQLKKFWFDSSVGFSIPHIFSSAAGYVSGFGSTIVKDLPYLALSAVAIKFGKIGKLAGVVLAGAGIKTLAYDVAGIGNNMKE